MDLNIDQFQWKFKRNVYLVTNQVFLLPQAVKNIILGGNYLTTGPGEGGTQQSLMQGGSAPRSIPGGGGGYSTNVYTGRLRPGVQPLTGLYTIFHEKDTRIVHLLLTNGTPFTDLV